MNYICLFAIFLYFLQECRLENNKPKEEKVSFPDEVPYYSAIRSVYHPYHSYHSSIESDYDKNFDPPNSNDRHQPWSRVDEILAKDAKPKIPLDYIQNLNKYNVTDLLLNFIEDDDSVLLESRFGEDADERDAAVIPKAAGCIPLLTTVPVAKTEDPSMIYIPQCIRIERCSGCCNHELLSCQPTDSVNVPYRIIKAQYNGNSKMKIVSKEIIHVEQHLKCKCACKIQAKDCNIYQEYNKNSCECICKNRDEEAKCYKNEKKFWNPETCACECKHVARCTTDSSYDNNECRCVRNNTNRRRYALFEDTIFNP